jgi:hypothetical protein
MFVAIVIAFLQMSSMSLVYLYLLFCAAVALPCAIQKQTVLRSLDPAARASFPALLYA